MKCLIIFNVECGEFSGYDPNNLPNVFASPCVDITMCWWQGLWGLIHCSFVVLYGCCTLWSQFLAYSSAREWISTIFWIGWGIKSVTKLMILCGLEQIWPCQIINTWACFLKFKLLLKILVNDQLDVLFQYVYYFSSLHVSNNPVLIIRRINCINTSSGMCHSVPSWPAYRTVTYTQWHTRWCIDTIDSPDDEHWVAWNM
jgi:hypothetical protein